jgi:hypothetical protein
LSQEASIDHRKIKSRVNTDFNFGKLPILKGDRGPTSRCKLLKLKYKENDAENRKRLTNARSTGAKGMSKQSKRCL